MDINWASRMEEEVFNTFKYWRMSGNDMSLNARRNRSPILQSWLQKMRKNCCKRWEKIVGTKNWEKNEGQKMGKKCKLLEPKMWEKQKKKELEEGRIEEGGKWSRNERGNLRLQVSGFKKIFFSSFFLSILCLPLQHCSFSLASLLRRIRLGKSEWGKKRIKRRERKKVVESRVSSGWGENRDQVFEWKNESKRERERENLHHFNYPHPSSSFFSNIFIQHLFFPHQSFSSPSSLFVSLLLLLLL